MDKSMRISRLISERVIDAYIHGNYCLVPVLVPTSRTAYVSTRSCIAPKSDHVCGLTVKLVITDLSTYLPILTCCHFRLPSSGF